MARHSPAEPRVQEITSWLSDLVLHHGSVRAAHRAVAEVLNVSGASGTVYPNRLHALLSGDPSRGINTATLEFLEQARALIPSSVAGGERDRIRAEIIRAAGGSAQAASDGQAVRRIAEEVGIPPVVVARVLGAAPALATVEALPVPRAGRTRLTPDWSFQDTAVQKCVWALSASPGAKVGLIVPTGGGKTRIATRVMLEWLQRAERNDTVVLWVTHRQWLREQARRELQRALSEGVLGSSSEAAALFEQRVRFVMISELERELALNADQIELTVVDEGHHSAAPSYRPLFDAGVYRALFLTATPNRRDNLPIGIETIAFSVTYRELFDRGVIVEPRFDDALVVEGLHWHDPGTLSDLVDYLLERTEDELKKVLVAVTRKEHAETLYELLQEQLDGRQGHPLSASDIAFVHAGATSRGIRPADFLDEFSARPRGILVATSQLVGEGFDDPAIDSVVVTYPSSSTGHLMQVAGRALRSAPGKQSAHIVQVHSSRLEYHFSHRWLYADISDRLRPGLVDRTYCSLEDLRRSVTDLLESHRVSLPIRERVLRELESTTAGERVGVLLSGLPYSGSPEAFSQEARWGAVLSNGMYHARLVQVFNEFSDRGASVNSHQDFLRRYLTPDPRGGSEWKSYIDMLAAMEFAQKELDRAPYFGAENRPYVVSQGTSWLKYVTFEFAPALPTDLEDFLRDCVNADTIAQLYLEAPEMWDMVVKVSLPVAGAFAFALTPEQAIWLDEARIALLRQLGDVQPVDSFAEIERWRAALDTLPVPYLLVSQIAELVGEVRFSERAFRLTPSRIRSMEDS
jgi:superfamily II DNA or RNA helicase